MNPDQANVNRLGFEAWADNLIVNLIEDVASKIDEDSYNVRIEKFPGETNYIVSAYVQGHGWLTHHKSVKR
jgi:hypothetical protein